MLSMASRGSVNEWIERYLHYGKVTLHTAPVGSFNMCFRENVPGSYFVIFFDLRLQLCNWSRQPTTLPFSCSESVPTCIRNRPLHPVWQYEENFPCVTHAKGKAPLTADVLCGVFENVWLSECSHDLSGPD